MAKLNILVFKGSVHERKFDDLVTKLGDSKGERLYFVIKSNGGDPAAAMRTMWLLQDRFKKISAIVPQAAMSAATLMALGTDEIYMSSSSALGPLDLQIIHHIDESRISAIDVRDASFNIWGLVESLADRTLHNLAHLWELPRSSAAKIAYDSAISFVKPIMEKIDPYHLNSGLRSSILSEQYAKDLLISRMMAKNAEQADETAEYMANEYKSHDYAISMKEAETKLKLAIKNIDDLKEWSRILPLFEQTEKDNILFKEVDDNEQERVHTNQEATRKVPDSK